MQIGIPKESSLGELRVAATPATVSQLLKLGFTVAVESGAGSGANFDDQAYVDAGASIVAADAAWKNPLIFKLNPPTEAEVAQMDAGTTLVSFVQAAQKPELVEALRAQNITSLAMEMVPRISRAQSMDALSSMANISGYRAVIEAAHEFGRLPYRCCRY